MCQCASGISRYPFLIVICAGNNIVCLFECVTSNHAADGYLHCACDHSSLSETMSPAMPIVIKVLGLCNICLRLTLTVYCSRDAVSFDMDRPTFEDYAASGAWYDGQYDPAADIKPFA